MNSQNWIVAGLIISSILVICAFALFHPQEDDIRNESQIRLQKIDEFEVMRDSLIRTDEDRRRAMGKAEFRGFAGGLYQDWNCSGDILLLVAVICEKSQYAVERVQEMESSAKNWKAEELTVREVSPLGGKFGSKTVSFTLYSRDAAKWAGGIAFCRLNVYVEVRASSQNRDTLASILEKAARAQLEKTEEVVSS